MSDEDTQLDALEKEILSLKQSIIENDTNMELLQVDIESKTRMMSDNTNNTTAASSASIKELNTGLKARADKLLNSSDQFTNTTMDELYDLINTFQSTENSLQSFLSYLQKNHTKEKQQSTIRYIYIHTKSNKDTNVYILGPFMSDYSTLSYTATIMKTHLMCASI